MTYMLIHILFAAFPDKIFTFEIQIIDILHTLHRYNSIVGLIIGIGHLY